MAENTVTVQEVRVRLADHVGQAEEGTATVITRGGVPVATLVPITDFAALEEAADVALAKEAEAVLTQGGATVDLAGLLVELSTEPPANAD